MCPARGVWGTGYPSPSASVPSSSAISACQAISSVCSVSGVSGSESISWCSRSLVAMPPVYRPLRPGEAGQASVREEDRNLEAFTARVRQASRDQAFHPPGGAATSLTMAQLHPPGGAAIHPSPLGPLPRTLPTPATIDLSLPLDNVRRSRIEFKPT
jgi:hypothetical protein